MKSLKLSLIACLVFLGTATNVHAQISEDSELFITLKIQDSIFFEKSFNNCDLSYLRATISPDMKFYHDQSGMQNTTQFFENVEKYICSGIGPKPIRRLVPGSLIVFPLYNNGVLYGAIQKGQHNFYLREPDKEDRWTSTAKFTAVWLLENDKWMYADCLSYDHQSPSPKE